MYGGIGNMKKKLIALAVLGLVATLLANAAPTYAKALVFKYSDQVNIYITSVPCPIPKYADAFPYTAKAIKKANGKKDTLLGCFTGNDDAVTIQWQDINGKPSDQTVLPTDQFTVPIEDTI